MGRLLGQLFEITALFDMHLRPELILLQKTMVSVEGVARRLNPDHDLWAAASPVVERWMTRELSPLNKARDAIDQMIRAAKAIIRLAEEQPTPIVVTPVARPAGEMGRRSGRGRPLARRWGAGAATVRLIGATQPAVTPLFRRLPTAVPAAAPPLPRRCFSLDTLRFPPVVTRQKRSCFT